MEADDTFTRQSKVMPGEKAAVFDEENGHCVVPPDLRPMGQIPEGPFAMGTDLPGTCQDERPKHVVYVGPYWLDVQKVARASYQKFLQALESCGGHSDLWCHREEPAGKCHIPKFWDRQLLHPDDPVGWVDWYDAWSYAQWAEKTLPTEAQWEKAAKMYAAFAPYEDREESCNCASTVRDILGTGWEWCLDWYRSDWYARENQHDPCCDEPTQYKVCRGGIYQAALPCLRSTFRNFYPPLHREETVGFRCAKVLTNDKLSIPPAF